jgi:hypothetical protein
MNHSYHIFIIKPKYEFERNGGSFKIKKKEEENERESIDYYL